jgi:hypothetical protein
MRILCIDGMVWGSLGILSFAVSGFKLVSRYQEFSSDAAHFMIQFLEEIERGLWIFREVFLIPFDVLLRLWRHLWKA